MARAAVTSRGGGAALLRAVPPREGMSAERLARLHKREPDTTEAALRELLPSVRGWVYRLFGPHAHVDDVVQEAMTEIALSLPRFKGEASLRSYGHKICLRVAYRRLGKLKRMREVPLELVRAEGREVCPESRAMQRELLRRLYDALDRLSPKLRLAVVLCGIEGMEPHEAAQVQGVTPEAMRTRLKRGREQLFGELADDPQLAAALRRGAP